MGADAHLDRIERQSEPLIADLEKIVAGRPVDAVIDALVTVAARALQNEDAFPADEALDTRIEATLFTKQALFGLMVPTRPNRLRFTFWALYVAMISSLLLNTEE